MQDFAQIVHNLYIESRAGDSFVLQQGQRVVELVFHQLRVRVQFLERPLGIAQLAQVFGFQTVQHLVVEGRNLFQQADHFLIDVADQSFVFRPLSVKVTALLLFLHRFFLGNDAATEHKEYDQYQNGNNGEDAAEVEQAGQTECQQECDEGRHEPAGDDGKHAGHAIDGIFASPGTVGERGAHGHHERDVGCGERQFERGAECDEGGGHHQVDRGAHEVERQAFLLFFRRFEPFGNRFFESGRQEAVDGFAHADEHFDDRTRERRGRETFLFAVLAAQVDRGLQDGFRFFGKPKRDGHDDAGHEQEYRRGRCVLSGQGTHRQLVGGDAARLLENFERTQARHRDPDKVHEVVAGKGHRKRERAGQYNDAQRVILKQKLDYP